MAKKALCIGINNDPGTHMDLQGGVNDASDRAATLADCRVCLIADSCHSGTVTRAGQAEKDTYTRPRFMPRGNWLPDESLPKTRAGKPSASDPQSPQVVGGDAARKDIVFA